MSLCLLTLTACGDGREDREIDRKMVLTCVAPDKTHVAEFYIESGGGAAGWQTEFVAVRKQGDSKRKVILDMNRGYDVVLNWKSPRQLEIYYPDSARIDHWQSQFDYELAGDELLTWDNDLFKLPSKHGSLTTEKSHCGPVIGTGEAIIPADSPAG